MILFYVSIAIAIAANLFYYIIQKSTPGDVNPVVSLAVTYLTAAAACILLYWFYPHQESLSSAIRRLNWTSVCLGITIIGLEMGFLLAFRAGWNLSAAGILVNAVVGVMLIPVGVFVFREKITPANLAGVALCIAGLILISKK